MRNACILAVVLAAAVSHVAAQQSVEATYRGKVVDEKDQPIAGAKVAGYAVLGSPMTQVSLQEIGSSTTGADGAFRFTVKDATAQAIIATARKEGLASNWVNWEGDEPPDEADIVLGKPAAMAGVVVDEAGKPVAGATVRPLLVSGPEEGRHHIIGMEPVNWLIVKTDAEGKFRFDGLPAGARGAFLVEAPGKARTAPMLTGPELPYAVGQEDIKLVLKDEGRIEGVLVRKDGAPVAGAPVAAVGEMTELAELFGGKQSATTDKDGKFVLGGLDAGEYSIRIVSEKGPPDFIAAGNKTDVANGKTASGMKVEVERGGLLRVTVADEKGGAIPKATVTIMEQATQYSSHSVEYGTADDKGVAVFRLRPGQYGASASAQGYSYSHERGEPVALEEGKTAELRVSLKALAKVRGVVRNADGKVVEGAEVWAGGGFGPMSRGVVRTDGKGEFVISCQPIDPQTGHRSVSLVVRHRPRGLAAVAEITDLAKLVEITLKTGAVLKGQVVGEDGKPLPGARISAIPSDQAWPGGRGGKPDAMTDEQGRYQAKGMPTGKYEVSARADGFGASAAEAEVEEGAGEVEVEKMTLKPAKFSISGVVKDSAGKPVSGAWVFARGEGQPSGNSVRTDKDGKFTIEKLVEGEVSVGVWGPSGHGQAKASAGDKDVQITLEALDSGPGMRPGTRPAIPPATRGSEDF